MSLLGALGAMVGIRDEGYFGNERHYSDTLKDPIGCAIRDHPLPRPLHWFCIQNTDSKLDQKLFPVFGVSGGMSYCSMAILIHHTSPKADGTDLGLGGLVDDGRGKWFVIRFNPEDIYTDAETRIHKAIKALMSENA